jgi:T5SS/PEP-CTERM-associated repeat protein
MKKRNITLITAFAAAAAFAPTAQAAITANTGDFASWDKTVDGVTGNWSAFTNLGGRSAGTLEITNVGLGKEADMVSGGNVTWGNATITVTGSGAKLLMNTVTISANAGHTNAAVNVTGGGLISTANYQLGAYGTSITTVSGAGSTLTATTRLQIGRNGTGSSAILSLVDGGLAKTTKLQFAEDNGSGGYVQMGIGGILAVSGDKTGLTQAALFANNGLFSLNGGTRFGEIQYDAGAGFVNMTGATEGTDYTLTYSDSGANAGYTVLTMIPEPSSMSLLALGGLALLRRRRA